jgi:hypothetical protein
VSIDVRVISIGTLSAHPLWGEKAPVRTGHATTTLIRVVPNASSRAKAAAPKVIIVDPGLPQQVMGARLQERAGISPRDVTHVFLTRFTREHTRGILAFEHATWWISQPEREGVGVPLVNDLSRAAMSGDDEELKAALELDVAILKRCEPAPDRLADGVSLFPLHGVSPGCSGLIIEALGPRAGGSGPGRKGGRDAGGLSVAGAPMTGDSRGGMTTLITGDAVPTIEHLESGMVLSGDSVLGVGGGGLPNEIGINIAQARESLAEAVEIADVLVLGRDNMVPNPVRRPF